MMRLLVVANRSIESEGVCDAIVERTAAGPVQVTLVAPAFAGGSPRAPRTATEERMRRARRAETVERLERVVQQLRDAGVAVEGFVGGDPGPAFEDPWDPSRYDEVVVSCRPWLSVRTVPASGTAGA